MEPGTGNLPEERLASLLQSMLPFQAQNGNKPSVPECSRAIGSAAILCSLATSSYTLAENHVADFTAWTIYFAYVLALAEKWGLPKETWENELDIALMSMYSALERLCDELIERKYIIEGDPFYKTGEIYRVRMTHLIGLMSLYALWRRESQVSEGEHDKFIRAFCLENSEHIFLWGEYAMPQILTYYLFYRSRDASIKTDIFLLGIINAIVHLNTSKDGRFLSNPYYPADEIMPHLFKIADVPLKDSFQGTSYTLEGLTHLFVRRNLKQHMKAIWPRLSNVNTSSFIPGSKWEFYFWRSESGTEQVRLTPSTEYWEDLKNRAFENEGLDIPDLIKEYPIPYLGFLQVYPHRWNSSGIRWITSKLKNKR